MGQLESKILAGLVAVALLAMPVYAWLSHQQAAQQPEPVQVRNSPPSSTHSQPAAKPATEKATSPAAPQPMNTGPLRGAVLVLLLQSQSQPSHLDEPAFQQQLLGLQKDLGPRLLGGTLYQVRVGGWETWQPLRPVPAGERFRNADYEQMFQSAFQAVAELTSRAENRNFRTILLWESDRDPFFDPERDRKKIRPPAGRSVGLCYWFVNSRAESSILGDWFGATQVVRPPSIADIRTFALELAQP